MGLKDKLRRLEKAADRNTTTVGCPECDQTFRYAGDLAMKILVDGWCERTGMEYDPGPEAGRILSHPHPELTEALLRGPDGLPALGGQGRA